MTELVTTARRYPGLTRLLGTLDDGWRHGAGDVLDYLADGTESLSDADTRALAAELAQLCDTAAAEYDYVSVLIDSGTRFTPYGTFGSAGSSWACCATAWTTGWPGDRTHAPTVNPNRLLSPTPDPGR